MNAAWVNFIAVARADAAADFNGHAARFLNELAAYMRTRYKTSDVELLYDLIAETTVAATISVQKEAIATAEVQVLAAVDAVLKVAKPVIEESPEVVK